MSAIYQATQDAPEYIGPIDPEEVAEVAFDWSDWLTSAALVDIDASSFQASAGLQIGDGVLEVTHHGKTVTPPAPLITAENTCKVHVWITTATSGQIVSLENHVSSGQRLAARSVTMLVADR